MQISPEPGAFMTMMTQLLNVKSAVEVGGFTGYSALCIARGFGVDADKSMYASCFEAIADDRVDTVMIATGRRSHDVAEAVKR